MSRSTRRLASLLVACGLLGTSGLALAASPFTISFKGNDGEPIVNARFSLANGVRFATDSAGKLHFYEPGAMGERIRFAIECPSHVFNFVESDPVGVVVGLNPGASAYFTMDAPEGDSVTITALYVPGVTCSNPPDPYVSLSIPYVPDASDYFRIRIVDGATGRGVPLVQVHSPNRIYVSDSNGEVAFFEPDLMGQLGVSFDVETFGYELAGGPTVSLDVTSGGVATLALDRLDIAERIYRATGAGIYRDSSLLGLPQCSPSDPPPCIPPGQSLLNAEVLGQDTVQSTLYDGKIFWNWGDTRWLGGKQITRATAATSELEENGGLSPDVGTNYAYFSDANGAVRPIAPPCAAQVPPPPSPQFTWLLGLFTIVDPTTGLEELFSSYFFKRMEIVGDETVFVPIDYGIVSLDEAGEPGCSDSYTPPAVFETRASFGNDDAVHSRPVANGQAFEAPERTARPSSTS